MPTSFEVPDDSVVSTRRREVQQSRKDLDLLDSFKLSGALNKDFGLNLKVSKILPIEPIDILGKLIIIQCSTPPQLLTFCFRKVIYARPTFILVLRNSFAYLFVSHCVVFGWLWRRWCRNLQARPYIPGAACGNCNYSSQPFTHCDTGVY